MKKTYITPTQRVVEIRQRTILCSSPIGMSGDSQDNGNALSPELFLLFAAGDE